MSSFDNPFGGGFVIITFMKRNFVDELHRITEEEMLDYAAPAQARPGPITVNAAVFAGIRIAARSVLPAPRRGGPDCRRLPWGRKNVNLPRAIKMKQRRPQ